MQTQLSSTALNIVAIPLPVDNKHLSEIHDRFSNRYIASLEGKNIVAMVRKAIREFLPSGEANLVHVAVTLQFGPRSLQRQSCAEGTTFLAILNETRQEMVRDYLRDDSMNGYLSCAIQAWCGSS